MENRKVKGWKLVKKEHAEAVFVISGLHGDFESHGRHVYEEFYVDSLGFKNLKEAGVLDLWFEPVYEELFKVGDVVLGWFNTTDFGIKKKTEPWKIRKLCSSGYAYPEGGEFECCHIGNIRHATPEEIEEFNKHKLEVGKWYFYNGWLVLYKGIENGIFKAVCAFSDRGEFDECRGANSFGSSPKSWIPATPEEVRTALEKEAVKRGFKLEVGIIPIEDSRNRGLFNTEMCGSYFDYSDGKLYTTGHGRWCIFEDGKWATIIGEALPVIEGYTPEDKGRMINWGCYTAFKSDLRVLKNMGITSFNLIHEGKKIKISKEQTKQIFKNIEE